MQSSIPNSGSIQLVSFAVRLLPWFIGCLVAIIGVAIRNEWTTKRMESAIFSKSGDLKLTKITTCEKIQARINKDIDGSKKSVEQVRKETRDEIRLIHKKIDDLPEKIISMMRGMQ